MRYRPNETIQILYKWQNVGLTVRIMADLGAYFCEFLTFSCSWEVHTTYSLVL